MKAEMYYRETYPKELRLKIENQEEFEFLKLLFYNPPEDVLKRFKEQDLKDAGLSAQWKKEFIKNSNNSQSSEYGTYKVWEVIDEEEENMRLLDKNA